MKKLRCLRTKAVGGTQKQLKGRHEVSVPLLPYIFYRLIDKQNRKFFLRPSTDLQH